jgi:hypothetical protein
LEEKANSTHLYWDGLNCNPFSLNNPGGDAIGDGFDGVIIGRGIHFSFNVFLFPRREKKLEKFTGNYGNNGYFKF